MVCWWWTKYEMIELCPPPQTITAPNQQGIIRQEKNAHVAKHLRAFFEKVYFIKVARVWFLSGQKRCKAAVIIQEAFRRALRRRLDRLVRLCALKTRKRASME